MPAAAKGDGRAAAKAFVKYYIDLINYAEVTGDVRPLQRVTTHRCHDCKAIIDAISNTYQRGGWYRTAGWVPSEWFVVLTAESSGTVAASIHSPEQRYKPSGEAAVRFVDSSDFVMQFRLSYVARGWAVVGLMRT